MGLDFVGLGSMLKCGFEDEFETETDEVDVFVDFGLVVKWWSLPLFCWVGGKWKCRILWKDTLKFGVGLKHQFEKLARV